MTSLMSRQFNLVQEKVCLQGSYLLKVRFCKPLLNRWLSQGGDIINVHVLFHTVDRRSTPKVFQCQLIPAGYRCIGAGSVMEFMSALVAPKLTPPHPNTARSAAAGRRRGS